MKIKIDRDNYIFDIGESSTFIVNAPNIMKAKEIYLTSLSEQIDREIGVQMKMYSQIKFEMSK